MTDPLVAEAWLHERDDDAARSETIARADVLVRTSPYPFPWASSVRWARWSETEAEQRIDEVLGFFAQLGRRFVWLVGPSSTPRDLGERLRARGFGRDVEEDERILVAPLPITGLRENRDVRIVEVDDDETLRAAVRFYAEDARAARGGQAYERSEYGDRLAGAIFEARRSYVARRDRRGGFLLALLDGEAVGTAGWTCTADGRAVLLNGGIVRPESRGRGVYSEMVRWRAERALARGCAFAVVLASPRTSAPILTKRGFVTVGAMGIYYSPG